MRKLPTNIFFVYSLCVRNMTNNNLPFMKIRYFIKKKIVSFKKESILNFRIYAEKT